MGKFQLIIVVIYCVLMAHPLKSLGNDGADSESEVTRIELSSLNPARRYRVSNAFSHLSSIHVDRGMIRKPKERAEFFKTLDGVKGQDKERARTAFTLSDPLKLSVGEAEKLLEGIGEWAVVSHCDHRPTVFTYKDDFQKTDKIFIDKKGVTYSTTTIDPNKNPPQTELKFHTPPKGGHPVSVSLLSTNTNPPHSFYIYGLSGLDILNKQLREVQFKRVNETGEIVIVPAKTSLDTSGRGCPLDKSKGGTFPAPKIIVVPLKEALIS